MPAFNDIMLFMKGNQPKFDQLKVDKLQVGQYWKILVLCIAAAIGNAALCHLVTNVANLQLYMDTMFTVAMCFSAGLLAGILTGALFSPLCFYFVTRLILGFSVELSIVRNIYLICIVVEAVLVCLYYSRMRTREAVFLEKPSLKSFVGVGTELLLLVVLDCIAVSITGGIIDFILYLNAAPRTFSPEDTFKWGLLRNNVPLLISSILSRIPINMVDRFIAIFGGYGISLLFRKIITKKKGCSVD
jgi:hypothetical protein